MGYQTGVYREQGGAAFVVTSAGSFKGASAPTATSAGTHLALNSGLGGAVGYSAGTIKLNSQTFTQTTGDVIGFQSKPNSSGATGTACYGAQISPRFAHGAAGTDLIGLQSNPILKGTAAAGGDLTGDVRCFEARLESETAGARTVTGGLFGIRFMNFLKSTITATGGVYPITVDTHGDTLAWSGFAKLPADGNIAKYSVGHYTTLGFVDGAIKVVIGASPALWIPCYVSIAA